MALLNLQNMKKAKALLDKNRDKVSGAVEKGAATLDKATKGKTANVSAKATSAARKYAGNAEPVATEAPPNAADPKPEPTTPTEPTEPTEPRAT